MSAAFARARSGRLAPAALLAVLVAAGPAAAETAVQGEGTTVDTPSGHKVDYLDTIQGAPGPEGLTVRFRFVAPWIAGDAAFDAAEADMQWLCDNFALPRIPTLGPQPAQIVISLSAKAIPFGEPDETVTQYFEAYRPENGACIWEMF